MRLRRSIVVICLTGLPIFACDSSEREMVAEEEESEEVLVAGELGLVLAGNDTVASGIVMFVLGEGGERTPAIFRGPAALAEVYTDGTYEMESGSLPSRVQMLKEGERIEMARR